MEQTVCTAEFFWTALEDVHPTLEMLEVNLLRAFCDLNSYTLPGINMEVKNHLFVVENGLPRGHSPLPC